MTTHVTLELAEVREALDEVIEAVTRGDGNVVVARDGVGAVAIVPLRELERFERYIRQREQRFAVIDEMRARFKDVPDDEIERETDRILAGIRAERRAAAVDQAAE